MPASPTETISSAVEPWRLLATGVSKHRILVLMEGLWEWPSLLPLTATSVGPSGSAGKIQPTSTQACLTMKAFTTTIWTCIKISTWTSLLNGRQQFGVRRKSRVIAREVSPLGALLAYPLASLWLFTHLHLLLRQGRPERSFRLCLYHYTFIWLGLTRCTVEFWHVGHWANG